MSRNVSFIKLILKALSRVHHHLGLHDFDYPSIFGHLASSVIDPSSSSSSSSSSSTGGGTGGDDNSDGSFGASPTKLEAAEAAKRLQEVFDDFYPSFESRTVEHMYLAY
jgi:hypothetical protein